MTPGRDVAGEVRVHNRDIAGGVMIGLSAVAVAGGATMIALSVVYTAGTVALVAAIVFTAIAVGVGIVSIKALIKAREAPGPFPVTARQYFVIFQDEMKEGITTVARFVTTVVFGAVIGGVADAIKNAVRVRIEGRS